MQVIETAYDEIVDLFARGSGPEAVIRFSPSEKAQQRARYLLQRNRENTLTPDESAELERLGQLEHVMQLVKARARLIAETNDKP